MPIPRSGTAGLGVVLYLAGVAMFAVNDALGKWLVTDYGVGQLMLLRTIGAAVVLAPMLISLRVKLIDRRRPGLQVLRVLCAAGDTFAFYYATRTMPLADVMTFYMATPLIITALSAPLLGEKVERFRWIAVLIGFVGVLIALRPSPQMFTWGAPIALFGAISYALSQVITRDLRGIHWAPLVLWQFVGSGLIGAATIPFAWTTPSLFDLGLMFLVGVVAMICIICVVRALGFARVAVLAPLQYTGLLWAAILGWVIWHDVPTLPIVVGNAIIIGSGLYVAARGRMAGQPAE
jgi:S-adenosylmethionine uptake transporter